jgi:hypothetical protein
MDATSVGQPPVNEGRRVVKTSKLTYFNSDPRHIFQGFQATFGGGRFERDPSGNPRNNGCWTWSRQESETFETLWQPLQESQ